MAFVGFCPRRQWSLRLDECTVKGVPWWGMQWIVALSCHFSKEVTKDVDVAEEAVEQSKDETGSETEVTGFFLSLSLPLCLA